VTLQNLILKADIEAQDIARRVGVSKSVVSLVVSGRARRERIAAATVRLVTLAIVNEARRRGLYPRLDPMRNCLECRQPFEEREDGVVVCGCEGAERFPARSVQVSGASVLRVVYAYVLRRRRATPTRGYATGGVEGG